jgi:hypothetical protein
MGHQDMQRCMATWVCTMPDLPDGIARITESGTNSHLQLCDLDTAICRSQVVSIAPLAVKKLRAGDDNLLKLDALTRLDLFGNDVHASAETKHEGRVFPVQYKVAARQEHLSWCGDGGWCGARHFRGSNLAEVPGAG